MSALRPTLASNKRTNDWDNEIHPNRGGYRKLAETWAAEIARVVT